jgi:hypothetical protein
MMIMIVLCNIIIFCCFLFWGEYQVVVCIYIYSWWLLLQIAINRTNTSEIDDLNSKIADGLYSDGWSGDEIDEYIADLLLDEYDQLETLDPIDSEVRKYYLELLSRLSNAEQEYILNAIVAAELVYNEEWNKDEWNKDEAPWDGVKSIQCCG